MDKSQIVLHGILMEGKSPKIILCESLNTFPEYPFNIKYFSQPFYIYENHKNLEINMYCDSNQYNNFETKSQEVYNDSWTSVNATNYVNYFIDESLISEAGKYYSIEIKELPDEYGNKIGYKDLKAKTYIPTKIPITIEQQKDVINYEELIYNNSDTLYNSVYHISFSDPVSTDDYYYLSFSKVICSTDFIMDTVDMDDLWNRSAGFSFNFNSTILYNLKYGEANIEGMNFVSDNASAGFLFADESFNGETKIVQVEIINRQEINDFGYFVVELMHVSEEYYKYYKSVYTQGYSQYITNAESTQIFTNIENGIGIFAGANMSTSYIKLEPNP
ncbi:MAG: hypothetical protein A2W99_15220 [Bacteroidetes bacterium GWF2_33_16]|nr:MAG: hypothetical protein A2X00_09430 [Bacteroidetes bacterium GWE2_32_14]OFY07674.1 MAG: hypothetical protein A2W99_15220 [Bacteroidetes bacterium GWF2_33_16]